MTNQTCRLDVGLSSASWSTLQIANGSFCKSPTWTSRMASIGSNANGSEFNQVGEKRMIGGSR
ncbi:hypothetical protein T4B_14046 [Trichinella pseudospiralis]|nr:hypothetical protein T4E_5187 [Trichinella pseudospiralis]KRY69753.1 hypothetical protein T4A_9250 [Trichinella pseudospiralis]KRY85545.1 hypothetical protein T4D_12906 [Trichinella pseudospiralis]KRZ17196.1 hypothetical protein T4B_14046 [Trichinella pseudospiralis]KRZ41957.1 hypothetical protein T4C_7270 [Trichinella pseudospiralis]